MILQLLVMITHNVISGAKMLLCLKEPSLAILKFKIIYVHTDKEIIINMFRVPNSGGVKCKQTNLANETNLAN